MRTGFLFQSRHQLPSFTATKVQDNEKSELYKGVRVNAEVPEVQIIFC